MNRRIEVLLDLYRLALRAPEEPVVVQVSAWLAQRQRLIDDLSRASPVSERSIENALLALILHADRFTYGRLLAGQQRTRSLLRQRARPC